MPPAAPSDEFEPVEVSSLVERGEQERSARRTDRTRKVPQRRCASIGHNCAPKRGDDAVPRASACAPAQSRQRRGLERSDAAHRDSPDLRRAARVRVAQGHRRSDPCGSVWMADRRGRRRPRRPRSRPWLAGSPRNRGGSHGPPSAILGPPGPREPPLPHGLPHARHHARSPVVAFVLVLLFLGGRTTAQHVVVVAGFVLVTPCPGRQDAARGLRPHLRVPFVRRPGGPSLSVFGARERARDPPLGVPRNVPPRVPACWDTNSPNANPLATTKPRGSQTA
jgi:hypothetical protein